MKIIDGKDPELWKIAKKRAAFRKHLMIYIIIVSFFWILWYGTGHKYHGGLPWPGWAMLGWGIGLAFNYFDAFHDDEKGAAEKEYEKLMRQRNEK